MKNIELKTPITTSDSISGISDSGIETFTNDPLVSLTKEELQNSTDQALKNDDGTPKKVTVQFKSFYLSREDLPEYEKTKAVYQHEREFWDGYLINDKRPVVFFDRALEILSKDKIRCFRISDYNTTGLTGIHSQQSSAWNNLVKNSSVSDKRGEAGGSYGIGKNAAFACSQLRIVFYNTVNEDGEEAFQGCMKVPNYIHDDNTYSGINFYCLQNAGGNKCLPLEENTSLDKEYKRPQNLYGMDKFIIGFNDKLDENELKQKIITSSIDNFLVAFYFDLLEIFYEDDLICKENLEEYITNLSDDAPSSIRENYDTLKNYDDLVKYSMFEDDDIEIYIKLNPNYGRTAAVVRQNGMKVFEKTRLNGRIGFKAVVYLRGNEVNEYFKTLENTEHTQWSNEKAADPKDAARRQKEIWDKLKAKLKELNDATTEASVDSDGLGEYLPMAYVTGKKEKIEGLSNEVEDTRKKPKKKKKKEETKPDPEDETKYQEDENGNVTFDQTHQGEKETPGPLPPFPPEPADPKPDPDGSTHAIPVQEDEDFVARKEIPAKSLKYHLLKNGSSYTLKLTPNDDFRRGYLNLEISGEDKKLNIEAEVSSAEIDGVETKIRGNKIVFNNLNKAQTYNIEFELKMPGEWALEVKAYESKHQ